MSDKKPAILGPTQETLLIPLYGRAMETRKRRGVLRDPKAVAMVEAIDYDFARFDGERSLLGTVLRTLIFDAWVRDFVDDHPAGTVVEIGAGLNTRFDRVDNGRLHWIDLDLPDVIDLRRRFFAETDRYRMLPASVLDETWIRAVTSSPGPYFFAAEAVLMYLTEADVKRVLTMLVQHAPASLAAFDTGGRRMVSAHSRNDALADVAARMTWICDDPRDVERWALGVRLLESRTLAQPPARVRPQLPAAYRYLAPVASVLAPRSFQSYKCNLYRIAAHAS